MNKFIDLSILQQQLQLRSKKNSYRELIRAEANIGGKLFGEVPKNRRREFFCLDERTWVWHEEWYDLSGRLQTKTTRYEVQPSRVIKVQDGQYYNLDKAEAKNFYKAIKLYCRKVRSELYAQAV